MEQIVEAKHRKMGVWLYFAPLPTGPGLGIWDSRGSILWLLLHRQLGILDFSLTAQEGNSQASLEDGIGCSFPCYLSGIPGVVTYDCYRGSRSGVAVGRGKLGCARTLVMVVRNNCSRAIRTLRASHR